MSSPPWHTTVVIPTYNERQNIGPLVTAIVKCPSLSVVIVDDHSPDGTGALADQLRQQHRGRVAVLHHAPPRSFAGSYTQGFRHALELGAEYICQMDADFSHDPEDLPSLVAVAARDADVAVGSRYTSGGGVRNWPRRRQLLSRWGNEYVRRITQLQVNDATSGFKCWRRAALQTVLDSTLQTDGYALQVEMLFRAARAGYAIAEVPIVFTDRRHGRSKISWWTIAESAWAPLRLIAGDPTSSRPSVAFPERRGRVTSSPPEQR